MREGLDNLWKENPKVRTSVLRLLRNREHELFIRWPALGSFALPTARSIECFINNRTHNVPYFLSTNYLPKTQPSPLPALVWDNFHNSFGDGYWKRVSSLQLNSGRATEIENLRSKIKNISSKQYKSYPTAIAQELNVRVWILSHSCRPLTLVIPTSFLQGWLQLSAMYLENPGRSQSQWGWPASRSEIAPSAEEADIPSGPCKPKPKVDSREGGRNELQLSVQGVFLRKDCDLGSLR